MNEEQQAKVNVWLAKMQEVGGTEYQTYRQAMDSLYAELDEVVLNEVVRLNDLQLQKAILTWSGPLRASLCSSGFNRTGTMLDEWREVAASRLLQPDRRQLGTYSGA